MLKFGFSEKATKFEKIFDVLLKRASCSVRATVYCTCQKVDEDFSKQRWSSCIIQTLPTYACKLRLEIEMWRRFQNHNPLCCYVTVRWLLRASMLIFSGGLLGGSLLKSESTLVLSA